MKKILFIVPHLSTGGLPQVTTNKIQLLKDDYIIKCVEYGCYSWDFVVQKNRIKNLIGEDNLITLWDDKNVLIDVINDFQPDIISMEEFPEFFMDNNITKQIYRQNRPYKIFETTHDSSFKPTSKVWFPDKFIFVSVFNAIQYSMFDIPYEVIEYPIENREKRKELFQEKLGLDKGWKHVVNVGLFTERKNQKYIFEIARKLENSKIKFHFIGNQADNFKSYWEPLMNNKPENCIIWGEKDNVNEFLEASDLFMFPSKGDRNNKELNPIAIKEAIEYGIPMMMYNLDVYCGKYDKLPQVTFLTGDIDKDVNNMMDVLNVGGIDSLFSFGFNGDNNQITINYTGNQKLDFNVSIRDITSKAPMYWFNLPLEYPIFYWTMPIPIHIKKFKDNPNFRGFLVEFYDSQTNELVFGQELIVNPNFHPRIPEFKFKPLDCNYINYYEFFVDRCFDDLKLENLDTVIDIGANVGLFAKYMYTINAKKVILVEANPYLQESIEYHLDGDLSKSIIYMNPVYKEHTKIDFRFSKENSTIGSNVFDGNVGEYGQLNNLISCDTITIDDIYKDNNYGRISLFKCDIEGGEYPIFESITDEQIGLVDRFMVEFHENTNGEINIILEKLDKNNFEYEIIVYEMGRKTKANKNAKHGVIFAKPKNVKLRKPGTLSSSVYDVTKSFEERLAEYTGAPYAVTIDNQSNALFLALYYEKITGKTIKIPSRTYPSVPCEIIHAGGKVEFEPVYGSTLKGPYQLSPTNVWDSALRFTNDMYIPETHMCLSFTGPYKHLKLGKGGAILTDDFEAYKWFKRARYSGRNEVSYHDDNFDMLGWNFYMMPEIASRGLLLMNQFYNMDGTPKHNEDLELPYPDLSKFDIYTK
jgi:FkbM family methyltransferase